MKHRLENERQFIKLVQQLTLIEQQQVLQRLKDLTEQRPIFEYMKFPLRDLPPTIP